jgi:serine/threonine protein kinase
VTRLKLKNGYSIKKIHRAVENPSLNLFEAKRGDDVLLVKVFKQKGKEDAIREISQYEQLKNHPFVPILIGRQESSKRKRNILMYKWLNGENAYDFSQSEQWKDEKVRKWFFQSTINNMITLSNSITENYYKYIKERGTKFSLSYPIYKDTFNQAENLGFSNAYMPVTKVLIAACKNFPGIYTDRNPGNLIVDIKNQVYFVDFGIIEATTPIFDLTKLLRTWTGEGSVTSNTKSGEPYYNSELEENMLKYAYVRFSTETKHKWNTDFSQFIGAFKYAALNEHIFYLTKSKALIKSGYADIRTHKLRCNYHTDMLAMTYNNLIENGEALGSLKNYIYKLLY